MPGVLPLQRFPVVLYNADGYPIAVSADGSYYRLQTEGQIQTRAKGTTPAGYPTSEAIDANRTALHVNILRSTGGQLDAKVAKASPSGNLVYLEALDAAADVGRLKASIYTPDGDPVAFGAAPANPTSIRNTFVKNGTVESLLVNGSVTPQVYTYTADPTYDVSIQEVKFVLVANAITFGTNAFGSTAGPLANGLLVQITAGGVTATVYNLIQDESFVNFASPGGFEWVVSSKDMMSSTWLVGGGLKLHAGTGDNVKVTVRDNLSAAGVYFKCFVKGHLLMAT